MTTATIKNDIPTHPKVSYAHVWAGFGALGTALQNYQAVLSFLQEILKGAAVSNKTLQLFALGAGGLCSGLVNYWMNLELLEDFIKRIKSKNYPHKKKQFSLLEKVQYFGGIAVFVVTGILFGLMAMTFALQSPFALFSIAVGCFVSTIMTIQEVETWLSSYNQEVKTNNTPLTTYEEWGQWAGKLIAIGNVIALSLLFTLSLMQSLMLLNVTALPALIIAASVAFSFGAFTEYYFYHFYLASFCQKFSDRMRDMNQCANVTLGYICVLTNAFVNAALTYAGVLLLASTIITANLFCPPLVLVTLAATISAIFAGSASFTLGIDFWIRQNPKKEKSSTKTVSDTSQTNQFEIGHDKKTSLTPFSWFSKKNLSAKKEKNGIEHTSYPLLSSTTLSVG